MNVTLTVQYDFECSASKIVDVMGEEALAAITFRFPAEGTGIIIEQ